MLKDNRHSVVDFPNRFVRCGGDDYAGMVD
jgi:hypothetical protein